MNIFEKITNHVGLDCLSLFDGISGGQLALKNLGLPINRFYSSEIDPYPKAITSYNFPNTIDVGDVTKVKGENLPKIDILFAGSPCQGFSFAKGSSSPDFDDPRSRLFFEVVRLIKETKPEIILIENVPMKKESSDVFTKLLGINFVKINSALVSAQNRKRLYWFGIRQRDGTYKTIQVNQPEDLGIMMVDILEITDDVIQAVDRNKSHCIDASYYKGGNLKQYFDKHRRQLVFTSDSECKQVGIADIKGHDLLKRVYSIDGKSPTATANSGGNQETFIISGAERGRYQPDGSTRQQLALNFSGKTNALTTVQKDNVVVSAIRDKSKTVRVGGRGSYDRHEWDSVDNLHWRKLTVLETERLQTLPDGYTSKGIFRDAKDYDPSLHEHLQVKDISNTRRYKAIGNGWTISVIEYLLSHLVEQANEIKMRRAV